MLKPAAKVGRSIIALVLAVLAAGCIGKGGTSTRYYLVEPVADSATAGTSDIAIEIMDLEIPQYLERFQIAVRSGPGGVLYSEYHQWGESLRKNLLRTLARNLSGMVGTADVGTPLNRSMSRPDFRLQVHIDQFEQDVDGHVRLKARWQLLDTRAPDAVPSTHAVELASGDALGRGEYEAMVGAMSALLGTLSAAIAAEITGDQVP